MAPSSGPAAPGRTPSAGGTIDDLLADLNSGDPSSIRLAAGRLRRPDDWPADRRPEVASALASLATGSGDQGIRDASARALTGWAGPEQLPALGQMLTDSHFVVRRQALEALGSIGSAEAAGVAASAADLEGRAVVQALRAIGPPAEPAALGLLGHPEWSVRMEICRLLGEIGGPSSVDPLRRATGDEHRLVQLQARQALDAIARRN
jgi:HEAT repeat protein